MGIDILTGAHVVAPAGYKVFLASLKKGKKGQGEKPTDDPGYTETLELMRKILHFCALSSIEEIQKLTNARIPSPPSCICEDVEIPYHFSEDAADLIRANLDKGGNLERVGKTWWEWRKPGSYVRAEWVEMRHDLMERQQRGDPGTKVIFYLHGGGYHLGGLGHAPQIQRHARKLKGRVFAPRYRLAPQFPFPCGVQDILAAYLYLLTIQDPKHIVIAGDSAGGGLCMALLLVLREQGLPMPAGASLISPWVDLTHSFPSIIMPTEFDYVPAFGFHAKPTLSWPPPSPEEMRALGMPEPGNGEPPLEIELDGRMTQLTDQFQMYAANLQLQIPLVSSICAASLGGLCPVQIITGGGEVLRDEQMYLAHKMADPESYLPAEEILVRNGETMEDVLKYPPTDVQLLVFDHGAHAQPTLGHTNIAKHQYRAVAQFAAWALAKAQKVDIEIDDTRSEMSVRFEDQDAIASVVEDSADLEKIEMLSSMGFEPPQARRALKETSGDVGRAVEFLFGNRSDEKGGFKESPPVYSSVPEVVGDAVGRAGDPIPKFVNHMIRCRVDRAGQLFPLPPASELRCCNMPREQVGMPKEAALKGWWEYRAQYDIKWSSLRKKIFEERRRNVAIGYLPISNGEIAPTAALAGRRVRGAPEEFEKPRGKAGKGIVGALLKKLESPPPQRIGTATKQVRRKSRMVSYVDSM